MILLLFGFILLFITILQAYIPRFLKPTIVFGVNVPEQHEKDKEILQLKNRYTAVVLFGGLVIFAGYIAWALLQNPQEEVLALVSVGVQIGVLFLSVAYYFIMHTKMKKLKEKRRWFSDKNEVKVVDLGFQEKLQLLPRILFIIPMIVSIGLIFYTLIKYPQMPDMIPTHWGPTGEADAFSEKSYLTVISLPLILLIMQVMFLFTSEGIKMSGTSISPQRKKTSVKQQLAFRKYSSWLSFVMSVGVTLLMGYLHLQTIHPEITSSLVMIALPIGFLVLAFASVAIFTVKVGQGGSRLKVGEEEVVAGNPHSTSVDDDRFWKGGIFYINKDDPSVFVEKRFGVGWSVNYARPLAWLFILGPALLIIGISFLL